MVGEDQHSLPPGKGRHLPGAGLRQAHRPGGTAQKGERLLPGEGKGVKSPASELLPGAEEGGPSSGGVNGHGGSSQNIVPPL